MARLFATLALFVSVSAVCVSAQTRTQTCAPQGGRLFSVCSKELEFLNQPGQYPLTSTTLPDDAKVQSVVSAIKAEGLPTDTCCATIKTFDADGCGCEASLAGSLKSVGIDSTPQGLQGVTKLAATACNFEPFQC